MCSSDLEERVHFFEVVAYGPLAENVSSLPKGVRIVVTGKLEQRSWTTENDEKRTVIEIHADDIAASLKFDTVQVTKTEKPTRQSAPVDDDAF